jgi:hypothetical protein
MIKISLKLNIVIQSTTFEHDPYCLVAYYRYKTLTSTQTHLTLLACPRRPLLLLDRLVGSRYFLSRTITHDLLLDFMWENTSVIKLSTVLPPKGSTPYK